MNADPELMPPGAASRAGQLVSADHEQGEEGN